MRKEAIDEDIKNLRCCGNCDYCDYYLTNDCPMREDPDSTSIYSGLEFDEVCDNWAFDGITYEERRIE